MYSRGKVDSFLVKKRASEYVRNGIKVIKIASLMPLNRVFLITNLLRFSGTTISDLQRNP